MTLFQISKGLLSVDGVTIGPAYSGAPGHVDNPADEGLKGLGPIPEGMWLIDAPVNDPHTGPFSLPLYPLNGTDTNGRSGFFLHGDNAAGNQSASHGCIIAAHAIREQVWNDPDHTLQVIA